MVASGEAIVVMNVAISSLLFLLIVTNMTDITIVTISNWIPVQQALLRTPRSTRAPIRGLLRVCRSDPEPSQFPQEASKKLSASALVNYH